MTPQHIVIAGGSSGIGLAAARQLSTLGFHVTITGRSAQRLASAKQGLPSNVATAVMDATQHASVQDVFQSLGAFDHLVLAFGSAKGAGPFASVSLSDVRQGFEEKVFPQFACAQAALPFLRKDGSITFISAVTARSAMPGTAGIGAANAAVAALVPILANELQPLRVNGISPGVVDTPWWDFLPADQKMGVFADFASKTPAGRVGQADDVAQAIALLVSNTFISGHTIVCDGGLQLGGYMT